MDDRLRQYLQECKRKKLTWNQVEHVLEGSNYPPETVVEAKSWYENPTVIKEPDSPVITVNVAKPKKKAGRLGLGLFGILVLMLMGGGYGTLYMVGIQKLTLPNQNLQATIEKLSISVPGVPRNPKLILSLVEEAHKHISKSSFNATLTGKFQNTQFNTQIKGYSDLSDSANPKFFLNIVSSDLNIDILKPDQVMYLKLNKLPETIYTLIGLNSASASSLLDNWLGLDISQNPPQIDLQSIKASLTNISVSQERSLYKISADFSKDQLKRIHLNAWVDPKTMLIKEINIAGIAQISSNAVDFNADLSFTDYGKEVEITKPDKFLFPEEFLNELMRLNPKLPPNL